MSAEKLSPRQQMISLMYLVLLAMLAMNASKDLLNAFVLLEKGIGVTNNSFDQKNQNLYAEIQQAALTKAPSNMLVEKQSKEIKQLADELYLAIDKHKEWLITESGGLDENGIPLGKDNQDLGAEYFLTKKEGVKLKEAIVAYKEKLKSFIDADYPEITTQIEELLKTPQFTDPSGVVMEWENGISEHLPLAAVTANLTNIQSYIRNAETEVVSYLYNKVKDDQFKFNQLEGMVFNQKSYLLQNDSLRSNIFLGAFNTEVNPVILVGKYDTALYRQKGEIKFLSEVDTIVSKNGLGELKLLAKEVGTHQISGLIKIPHPNPKKKGEYFYYPFDQEYTVGKPNAAISLTKMNTIYKGVPNPIAIAVPGISADKIKVQFTKGTLTLKPDGSYEANATSLGMGKIIVQADMGNGNFQKMQELDVIIRRFPKPLLFLPGIGEDETKISKAKLKVALDMGPSAKYGDDFIFSARCRVTKYDIVFVIDGSSITYKKGESKTKLDQLVGRLRTGDKVYIEEATGKGPDNIPNPLNVLKYTIR